MRAIPILKIMGELGARFPTSKIWEIISYVSSMLEDERVIVISKDEIPYGVAFCSLSNDYEPFYKKDTWDYKAHDPKGKILYIELLCCKKWTHELREIFETELVKKYPSIEEACWHRWAAYGDRKVTYKRRVNHV